jgi:pyruvate,water dikinase
MKIDNWIKNFFRKGAPGGSLSPDDTESLRTAFKARYHAFKLLLNANNKALEIMTEMEEALQGSTPFGMGLVRARTTAISTNVFQIIKHLNELAPHKYEALFERFREIQARIGPFLKANEVMKEGPLVVPLEDCGRAMADQVGAKAANLGEIGRELHLPIPTGFVVTATGYRLFLDRNDLRSEIVRRIQSAGAESMEELYTLSASIQQLIIRASIPSELEEEIRKHYGLLEQKEGKGVRMAMRSSALGEDTRGLSFAGQYRSELNVSSESIFEAYREIVASKYSLQAMAYRLNHGIREEDVAMCVACMAMVDAMAGGVMYSGNPGDISDHSILISSVWGLPKAVVDGATPSDLFIISRDEPMKVLRKDIAMKKQKFACYPREGICRMDTTGSEAIAPSLSDSQAMELARISLRLEAYYGIPQDMEWAVKEDGSIIILQCRPLQHTKTGKKEEKTDRRDKGPVPATLKGGVSASPGVAAGPVFLARKNADVFQFPDGAVLVAARALPLWAPLLNRAAAVVTEQGGITGHLATVAREFGVPALFGLKDAMTVLKNGDMVTIDADNLRVCEGKVDGLMESREARPNILKGSPVYEALKGASDHIIPLHLLDPGAPEFNPGQCSTLHDITRFCHEKSVIEMFRFGRDHRFPERSSKQLYCDVPMQFWVINLDDGFKDEVTDQGVRLENISSVPMLSLWRGMTAVPWEGPPPVDSKGFMSVLFEATANPALDPATGTSYGMRNYFMISKNFCSLQSRFGFHFSTVEALVGERAMENYISFQFKGGAANLERRIFRAHFVSEILDQYDFHTEMREDAVFARLEGYEQPFMEERLRVLGYLIIHTRQLDMIMANGAAMNGRRQKILKDLRNIAAPGDTSSAGNSPGLGFQPDNHT